MPHDHLSTTFAALADGLHAPEPISPGSPAGETRTVNESPSHF